MCIRDSIEAIVEIAVEDLLWWPYIQTSSNKWESYDSLVEAVSAFLGWKPRNTECVWPGRSPNFGEDWVEGVTTRLSAAHNAESLESDLNEIEVPTVVLFGMSKKADLRKSLDPLVAEISMDHFFPKVVFTEPISGRNPAVTVEELSEIMEDYGIGYEVEKDPLKAFEIARYGDLRLSITVAEDADKIVVGLADVWVEIEKSGSDSFTVVALTSEDDEHGHDGVVMFTMNNTTK